MSWGVVISHLTIIGIDIGLISYFSGKGNECGNQLIIWMYGQCILHGGHALFAGKFSLPPRDPTLTGFYSFLDCCSFCVQVLVYPGIIFGQILEIVWIIYGILLIYSTRNCALFFPFLYSMLCVGTIILLGIEFFSIWKHFSIQAAPPRAACGRRRRYTILGYLVPFLKHQTNNDSCSICLEPFKETVDLVRILSCHHVFHSACIDSWLTSHSLCPLCRHQVRSTVSV